MKQTLKYIWKTPTIQILDDCREYTNLKKECDKVLIELMSARKRITDNEVPYHGRPGPTCLSCYPAVCKNIYGDKTTRTKTVTCENFSGPCANRTCRSFDRYSKYLELHNRYNQLLNMIADFWNDKTSRTI